MKLSSHINEAIKTAMKEKDQVRLRALRAIKSALLLAQTEKAGAVIDAAKELQILQKLAKQRRDSMAIYQEQNRTDLYEHEREELEVIETFLPQALAPEVLESRITAIIAATAASGMADLPKVMPLAMKELAGQADNKAISEAVKKLLTAQ
ncbi:MAG: glutamyl-tRNA amidotransferase [Sphingobacteriaceae bacterium]|nr:glutamyl-tRNA amidotransferase [Sphingobacteriaceae bacterium]